MNKFTVNQQLSTSSVCDSECIFRATVVKRTPKTVTINTRGEEKRCKIHIYEGNEFIYPFGKYSMCAIFKA